MMMSPQSMMSTPRSMMMSTPRSVSDESVGSPDRTGSAKAKKELSRRSPSPCELSAVYAQTVGNTELLDLSGMLPAARRGKIRLLGKAEFKNPSFSMKDRIVKHILEISEKKGLVNPRTHTIVCASSGNTGAAVAFQSSVRGYKAIIFTTAKCSDEKVATMRAYGAEVRIVEGNYMAREDALVASDPTKYFGINQYNSLLNSDAHVKTGEEIWEQSGGEVTHFIAASSTGGTLTGVARALKSHNPDVKILLADPVGSILHEYVKSKGQKVGTPSKWAVEGAGKKSITGIMKEYFHIVDDSVQATSEEAYAMCRELMYKTGICAGGSSGLNVSCALKAIEEQIPADEKAVVVTMLCDSGLKYLSKIYAPPKQDKGEGMAIGS